MADIKDWMALAKPDPEWEQAVKETMGGQPPDLGLFPDIESMRKWIINAKQAMSAQMGPKIEGVKEHDQQVSTRDGSKITCRVYQPENPPSGGSPLAVLYHGGGWCIGGLENEELLCRRLTAKFGMTCVNVDYRLAPEYKFPIPVYDCHDATKWAAANASSLGADPSKGFIIGGTSAGGGCTSAIAHLWRDEKIKPAITGCLLVVPPYCNHAYVPAKYRNDYNSYEQYVVAMAGKPPSLDPAGSKHGKAVLLTASYLLETNKNAPILSHGAINLFLDNYIPKEEDRKNPLFSSLLWETGHNDLPPSCFQICGQDPLRDEALIFERLLREDLGIKTKVFVYPGQPHGFHSVAPQMKASQKFMDDSVDGVGWLLEQA